MARQFEQAFYRRGFPALKYRGAGQQTFTSDVQNSGGAQGRLHWITIGGADEGDQKHAGGTHVLVDGSGKIQAGPGALQGKSLGGHSQTPAKRAEPQLPPEAPKRESDTIGDRNAAAGRHLDQLPPAIRDTIKNLHASRENRRTGQVTTDLLGEKLARSMYDDVKKRIGKKGDQFGHAVALENGGVGYASPAGAVQILPPAVKGQPWHVSYTSDVGPLEELAKKQTSQPKAKPAKPPKEHGDTFDPSEFGGSGAAAMSDAGRKLPGGRMGEAIQAAAQDYGIEPADLNDAADFVLEERQRLAREREAAKMHARKLTGLTAGDVSRLANSGHDYTSAAKAGGATGQKLRHFDEFAQEIAREFPELGLGDPDDPRADLAAGLWNLLAEGKQAIPSKADPEVLREAANLVMANNYSPQFSPDADYAEAFRRRGTVERYRRWQGQQRLRYAIDRAFARRWPNVEKLRYDRQASLFDDDEHPRGADGQFVEKTAAKKPVFENNEAKQANLFHGLDALPGQQDLFEGLDRRDDPEQYAGKVYNPASRRNPQDTETMPYEFREENGRVAAIDKKTGKVAFHSDSMEEAHKAAAAREEHEHMGYSLEQEPDGRQETAPPNDEAENELVGQFKAGFARRGFAEKYAASEGVVEGGKIPKVKAGYKPAFGAARCGACDHFKQGGRCTIVEGQVEANDVCDYFEPARRDLTSEATERYARDHAADLAKYAEQPSDKISPEKAKEMLADGTAHGHPLTEAQKGMLGAAVGRGEGK